MLEQSIEVYCKIGRRESQTVRFLSHQPDGYPELGTLDTDFGVSTTNSRGTFDSWNRSQELRLPRHFFRLKFLSKESIGTLKILTRSCGNVVCL